MSMKSEHERKAVMLDSAGCERIPNVGGLLKLVEQGEEAVLDGRVKSQEDVFTELEYRLALGS